MFLSMKNLVPEFATKSELFAFLRTNKSKLISQKKALPTTSDDLEFGYTKVAPGKTFGTKADVNADPVDGELIVEIIANMSGWCDSQMDVVIRDSWKKSIGEISASGQKISYHLKNHDYCMDAIVGKNPEFYTKDIDLSIFNIKTDLKKAQALMCRSTVMRSYDAKVYELYNDGQVFQHSIGLQYINLLLCLDSTEEEDAQEKKNWDKYYPQVINKEKVDNYGYFWASVEEKILEVSTVLWGANILTPVMSSGQPSKEDTGKQPPKEGTASTDTDKAATPIIGCPDCDYFFVPTAEGTPKCPNCGYYVSPNSTSLITNLSDESFDWKKAIETMKFIN
jgi:hypothetical protein